MLAFRAPYIAMVRNAEREAAAELPSGALCPGDPADAVMHTYRCFDAVLSPTEMIGPSRALGQHKVHLNNLHPAVTLPDVLRAIEASCGRVAAVELFKDLQPL